MKKKIYGMVMACLIGVLVFSSVHSANAAVISCQDLDNDDGAINGPHNMYLGSWTYLNSSGDYRGDARRAYNGSGAGYVWKFNSSSGGRLFYVYLNDYSFNNKYAVYSVIDSGYNGQLVGALNQESAPSGWNLVSSNLTYNNPIYPYLEVWAGTTSDGGYTGADAAEVDFNN